MGERYKSFSQFSLENVGMSVKYRETDSFSAPVAQDFMTYLLHEGIQFRTINVHR